MIVSVPSCSERASLASRTAAVKPEALSDEKTKPKLGTQLAGATELKPGLTKLSPPPTG